MNAEAAIHNYKDMIAVPIGEKPPKQALKDLQKEMSSLKIYEKMQQKSDFISVEDVIAQKRKYEESMMRISKLDTKAVLNEPSMTEMSLAQDFVSSRKKPIDKNIADQ